MALETGSFLYHWYWWHVKSGWLEVIFAPLLNTFVSSLRENLEVW